MASGSRGAAQGRGTRCYCLQLTAKSSGRRTNAGAALPGQTYKQPTAAVGCWNRRQPKQGAQGVARAAPCSPFVPPPAPPAAPAPSPVSPRTAPPPAWHGPRPLGAAVAVKVARQRGNLHHYLLNTRQWFPECLAAVIVCSLALACLEVGRQPANLRLEFLNLGQPLALPALLVLAVAHARLGRETGEVQTRCWPGGG